MYRFCFFVYDDKHVCVQSCLSDVITVGYDVILIECLHIYTVYSFFVYVHTSVSGFFLGGDDSRIHFHLLFSDL